MKPVVQEDITGCGLACVATVAGVNYRHVKKVADLLGIDVQDSKLWSNTLYVRKLLMHYGLSTSRKTTTFESWETLPSLALLAIKWHKTQTLPFWHWVVFYRGPAGPMVLDPKQELRTHSRTDFGRIKPQWYLTVTIL